MAEFYRIVGDEYIQRFHTRKLTLLLLRPIQNPVQDFMHIIGRLIDRYRYRENTVITFGGRDTNGKEFYINRFDHQPLFIHQLRDIDFFSRVLYEVCSLILNSGQTLEFEEGSILKVTFTDAPFEYMAQRGNGRK